MQNHHDIQRSDAHLRANIRFLGNVLGEVITEQEGKRFLELEEFIRRSAKEYRSNGHAGILTSLQKKKFARSNMLIHAETGPCVLHIFPIGEHRGAASPHPPAASGTKTAWNGAVPHRLPASYTAEAERKITHRDVAVPLPSFHRAGLYCASNGGAAAYRYWRSIPHMEMFRGSRTAPPSCRVNGMPSRCRQNGTSPVCGRPKRRAVTTSIHWMK